MPQRHFYATNHQPTFIPHFSTLSNSSSCEEDTTNVKVPWGRSRSYAGDGPICLPTEYRPKCEPPPVLQKTHHHFGSGLFPYPR